MTHRRTSNVEINTHSQDVPDSLQRSLDLYLGHNPLRVALGVQELDGRSALRRPEREKFR